MSCEWPNNLVYSNNFQISKQRFRYYYVSIGQQLVLKVFTLKYNESSPVLIPGGNIWKRYTSDH